ncbi:FliA/WhiG family RNA polymerase sigma factor [Halalkalibacter okhensis]|uniref:RNA polymerase sigma factor SigD n=1 Tax=Halalkalibacter okhensis TaxID=333138 RepID=A0A0B0IJB6_9BACI|nr:FliA/WhiG family RNA polymerase sigma factor [Halalkalibacter okhensis]KHF39756.1 RNA polymerase sigma factor SigD [Halalkalibacter okhensis]
MGHVTEDQVLWDKWILERSHTACDELIRRYMPLVDYHVKRISVGLPKNVRSEDLKSHGLIGLYDALEKFDPTRELKFDTYASFRVRGAIIDGLRKEDWLPRSTRDKIKKIELTTEKLEQQKGRYVTSDEIASELNMQAQEVEQVMSEYVTSNVLSIDEEGQESSNNETYASIIEDKDAKTPEQYSTDEETKKELAKVINELPEKERLVISLFYFEELTLTEIGQILELSTSRISQIHSKTLFKLQQVMRKSY